MGCLPDFNDIEVPNPKGMTQKANAMYGEIYLIDDEDLVNTINTIYFRRMGLEDRLKKFTNPELALDELRLRENKNERTLILLDINMPEMSGFEFLEYMESEDFPDSNEVLLVTSSESDADRQEAKKHGRFVREYITKPLQVEQLETYIRGSQDRH